MSWELRFIKHNNMWFIFLYMKSLILNSHPLDSESHISWISVNVLHLKSTWHQLGIWQSQMQLTDMCGRPLPYWCQQFFKYNTVTSIRMQDNIIPIGHRRGKKLQNLKCYKIMWMTWAHKCHTKSWLHMKLFSVKRKDWTLFCNIYASISDKFNNKLFSR